MKKLLLEFKNYFSLLYTKNLSYGFAGNASFRYKNYIYISPKGPPKEFIKTKDIIKVNINTKTIPNKASSDFIFHLKVYRKFNHIFAIFHAHTFYTSLYFDKYRKIPVDEAIEEKNVVLIKDKNWIEKSIEKMNNNTKILYVIGHGIFSFGKDIKESFSLIEHFENLCKLMLFKKYGLNIKYAQEIIFKNYFKKDSKRGFEKTFLWFLEEVGELIQSIRKKDIKDIKEEIADVFAWLLSICNLLNINLEQIFKEKYIPYCPKCGKSPCICIEK